MSTFITQSINERSYTVLFLFLTQHIYVSTLGLHVEKNTFDQIKLQGWHCPIFLNQNPFD